VVAQSDIDGTTTWAASYQADGRRTAEAGTNVERHRANTKEEDPTGLLNEGFRYRDMETGTFISRDPLGLVDGPNVYCYVRQNPWTMWDPEGLSGKRISRHKVEPKHPGHHKVPFALWDKFSLSQEAQDFLDTGTAIVETPNGHGYDAHGAATGYTAHVEAELAQFLQENASDFSTMDGAQQKKIMEQFVNHIDHGTKNEFIKEFNAAAFEGPDAVKEFWEKKGKRMVGSIEKVGYIKMARRVPIIRYAANAAILLGWTSVAKGEGQSTAEAAMEFFDPLPVSKETLDELAGETFEYFSEKGENMSRSFSGLDQLDPAKSDNGDELLNEEIKEYFKR
jgi:RHS repeat-associated protein